MHFYALTYLTCIIYEYIIQTMYIIHKHIKYTKYVHYVKIH